VKKKVPPRINPRKARVTTEVMKGWKKGKSEVIAQRLNQKKENQRKYALENKVRSRSTDMHAHAMVFAFDPMNLPGCLPKG
jgi:hypothetical protein